MASKSPFTYAAVAAWKPRQAQGQPPGQAHGQAHLPAPTIDLHQLSINGANEKAIKRNPGATATRTADKAVSTNPYATAQLASSTSTSMCGDTETRTSPTSHTTASDLSGLGDNSTTRGPQQSFWTGATPTQPTPPRYNPLAAVGSTRALPLSPVQPNRRSQFFPATQDMVVVNDMGGKQSMPTSSAFAAPGTPTSPFFSNGLSGGLVSGSSDVNYQLNKIHESVESYVTTHYASNPGTPPLRRLARPAAAAQGLVPSIDKRKEEGSDNISELVLSSDDEDGGAPLAQPSEQPATSTSCAMAPPGPLPHVTTLEVLEQAAGSMDSQRSLHVTRPRVAWDQVPNWRTWRTKGNSLDTTHELDAPLEFRTTSEAIQRHGMVSQAFPGTWRLAGPGTHGTIGPHGSHPRFRPFRPMNAVLHPDATKQPLSKEDKAFREEHGISLNYKGNHENPRNMSADIPNSQNCAVWMTNLPPDCNHRDLIKALTLSHPGRIWATHINPPVLDQHRNSAAKVVFYHPTEAQSLLRIAQRGDGIHVKGQRIRAILNKQRIAAQPWGADNLTSRVVEIAGDKALVNKEFLHGLFRAHFQYDVESVKELAAWDDKRAMLWRFGSMRAQAEAAYKLLTQMYPCLEVAYRPDPCAPYACPYPPAAAQLDRLAGPGRLASGNPVPEAQGSVGTPAGSLVMPWSASGG